MPLVTNLSLESRTERKKLTNVLSRGSTRLPREGFENWLRKVAGSIPAESLKLASTRCTPRLSVERRRRPRPADRAELIRSARLRPGPRNYPNTSPRSTRCGLQIRGPHQRLREARERQVRRFSVCVEKASGACHGAAKRSAEPPGRPAPSGRFVPGRQASGSRRS